VSGLGLVRSRATPIAVARIVSAGLAAVLVFVTSAVLSPATRGEFAALQTAVILLATTAGLSLPLGVSVVVGARADTSRQAALASLAGSVVIAVLFVPLGLAVAGPTGITQGTATAVALLAATTAGYGGLQGIPIGLGRTRPYAVSDVVRSICSLAAIAIGLGAGVRSPGALVAIWGAGPVAGAIAIARLPTDTPASAAPWRETLGTIVRRSLRAHPANLAGLAVARLDIVVLAAVSTHPQVAYYSLAVVIAEAAWLMPSALAVTSLSDFVRLPGDDAWHAAQRALRNTVTVAGVSGILAAGGGVVFTLAFLPHAYHAALVPLAIALAGAIPYSVGHVVSPYLVTAVDRPGTATAIALATLTVDLVLVLLLGGPLGAIGAAVASTAAYVLHAGLNLAALRRPGPTPPSAPR
jgi:O-antigen/teichoic acid export membrane protein